jgi:hypothetical protein
MQPTQESLNKLVSLTFDESPKVRREAARSLGALDDPAALFALVELSYDKDLSVKAVAQDILDQKKRSEKEVMSFAEMFSSGKKEEQGAGQPVETKEKVLQPITMLFEKRLGKEKADRVKQKMMPAIEKIYMKTVEDRKKESEPSEESGRQAMQEFLTSYLEAVSDVGEMAPSPPEHGAGEEHALSPEFEVREQLADELGEVATKERQFEMVAREVGEIEAADEVAEKRQDVTVERLPDTVFKKAYEAMMLSDGDDEIMKREMERAIKNAKHDVKLAYTLARKRFKETNITHITKIRNGMRNVNTEDLLVREAETMEYEKSKKVKDTVTRMVVNDGEGNEGVVYLFEGRGGQVKPGVRIRIVKGYVKTFEFSGETALTISKKGNVYIVL